jgi:hypothetical protein
MAGTASRTFLAILATGGGSGFFAAASFLGAGALAAIGLAGTALGAGGAARTLLAAGGAAAYCGAVYACGPEDGPDP